VSGYSFQIVDSEHLLDCAYPAAYGAFSLWHYDANPSLRVTHHSDPGFIT
jgi:hypothetical protein